MMVMMGDKFQEGQLVGKNSLVGKYPFFFSLRKSVLGHTEKHLYLKTRMLKWKEGAK